jgi:hypothetical protein
MATSPIPTSPAGIPFSKQLPRKSIVEPNYSLSKSGLIIVEIGKYFHFPDITKSNKSKYSHNQF